MHLGCQHLIGTLQEIRFYVLFIPIRVAVAERVYTHGVLRTSLTRSVTAFGLCRFVWLYCIFKLILCGLYYAATTEPVTTAPQVTTAKAATGCCDHTLYGSGSKLDFEIKCYEGYTEAQCDTVKNDLESQNRRVFVFWSSGTCDPAVCPNFQTTAAQVSTVATTVSPPVSADTCVFVTLANARAVGGDAGNVLYEVRESLGMSQPRDSDDLTFSKGGVSMCFGTVASRDRPTVEDLQAAVSKMNAAAPVLKTYMTVQIADLTRDSGFRLEKVFSNKVFKAERYSSKGASAPSVVAYPTKPQTTVTTRPITAKKTTTRKATQRGGTDPASTSSSTSTAEPEHSITLAIACDLSRSSVREQCINEAKDLFLKEGGLTLSRFQSVSARINAQSKVVLDFVNVDYRELTMAVVRFDKSGASVNIKNQAPQTTNFGPPMVWRTSLYLPF